MVKIYSQKTIDKILDEQFEEMMNEMGSEVKKEQPSQNSIDFILNYSKSLSVKSSKKIGTLYLNLN